MAKKASKEAETLTFEQAMQRLEGTVRQLEDGQLDLADALACYEDGVKHLKHCYGLLENAQRRIELVRDVDAAGKPRTESLDDEALSLEEKAESRGRRRTAKAARKGKNSMDSPEGLF